MVPRKILIISYRPGKYKDLLHLNTDAKRSLHLRQGWYGMIILIVWKVENVSAPLRAEQLLIVHFRH